MERSRLRALCGAIAVACACLSGPLASAIRLVPVVSGGLSSPVFVGDAGDGSSRLFIEEQAGRILVLQPRASTPTVFLDIQPKVVSGGEQGLLGLAFHPGYATNGRFFVYYTGKDGTIVIAEYRVSPDDPNVASPAESVLLTIPHPVNTNHNGGMLAFGPDGYLYIGVGDGGSANDPPANAQNVDVLLGKILRIDVDPKAGSASAYVSPPDNPFHGAIPGRDEIFAYGLRNPWRFSFDRGGTRAQWVGDVGQNAYEEVDSPIVAGGNYGWRVYEGFSCTGNDPELCDPVSYRFPVLAYSHANGRCSIIGGYVYRGLQGVLPIGAYVYGDLCTGEILMWDGTAQTVVLDAGFGISSFGEDEAGELYVVGLEGSVSRLAGAGGPTEVAVEYYNAAFDDYFVTAFPAEIAALDAGAFGGAWRRSGEMFNVWAAPVAAALPTCRYLSTSFAPKSSHFYTPYPAECAVLMSNPDWQFEVTAFYLQLPDAGGACAPGTLALFRLYNNGRGGAPNHRYTTSAEVFGQMVSAGWTFEGNGVTGAFACVP